MVSLLFNKKLEQIILFNIPKLQSPLNARKTARGDPRQNRFSVFTPKKYFELVYFGQK